MRRVEDLLCCARFDPNPAAEPGDGDRCGLGAPAPLGPILPLGAGGAQGIETRWHMTPTHQKRAWIWQLERRHARTAPPKRCTVTQSAPRKSMVFVPPGDEID